MKYESLKQIMFLKGTERKILDTLKVSQNIDFIDYVDDCRNTALHYAVSLGYQKAITLYFQLLGKPELWQHKFNGQITDQCIKYRIKLWINAENIDGLTAIHYASLKGLVNVAEILENAGARLDKTTSTGLSVLSLAAQENKIESMLFFRGKADINATDHKKCTALHWACFKGHEPIVKYLVCENETQLDFQESLGRTALHIAVIYGHERIVRTLLLAGSNRHIKDKQNKTAKDYAQELGKQNILVLLTHKSSSCCSKNSYTYKVVKKQNCAVLVVIFFMIYAMIAQNYIITSAINRPTLASILEFIHSLYFMLGQLFIATSCLILGLHIHYRKSIIQPIEFNEIKNNLPDMGKFCFWCHTNKEQGIEHCQLCRQCVVLKVKHSSVVGRCIGSQNIRKYVFFLGGLLLILVCQITKGILLLNYLITDDDKGQLAIPLYLIMVVDFAAFIPLAIVIYHFYKTLKILRKFHDFQLSKKLSETTLDTDTTLLANRIDYYQQKMKEEI